MMHRNRSRDPPPYHPGWGGSWRETLILEENTIRAVMHAWGGWQRGTQDEKTCKTQNSLARTSLDKRRAV